MASTRHTLAGRFAPLAALLFSAIPALAAPELATLPREDGSEIHFSFDRVRDAKGVIVLAQGSGCQPTDKNQNLASTRAAFPNYSALMVEKIGIEPGSDWQENTCPQVFYDQFTLTQRVADYQAVISHIGVAPKNLILLGGSEGGLVMAELASLLSPKATILISAANSGSLEDTILSTLPPEGQEYVAAGFAKARANPDSSELHFGASYRFWADALDRRTSEFILNADTNFLALQGTGDRLNPTLLARQLADIFTEADSCGFTYWEFSGLGHGLSDATGTSYLPSIAALAAHWLELAPSC